MINRPPVVAQRRRSAHRRTGRRGDGEDRLAADSLVLTTRQTLVFAFGHPLLIGAHELELERRRAGVEHEDVHLAELVSRAAAARARASASCAVSPYAETWPIFRPGRA